MEDIKSYAQGDRLVTKGEPQQSGLPEPIESGQPFQSAQQAHQPEEEVSQETQPSAAQPESSKEINLRILRERAERAERERDEAVYRARQFEQTPKQIQEPEVDIKDDDIPEGRHVKGYVDHRYKELDKRLKQYEERSAYSSLKSNFPDLEKVVTNENLQALRAADPDLADSILSNPNPYSQYAAAYRQIKLHGIYQEDNYTPDRARAQTNANKPRPLASINPQQAESPLSQVNAFANGLTDDLKKNLYKEMMESIKRRNS